MRVPPGLMVMVPVLTNLIPELIVTESGELIVKDDTVHVLTPSHVPSMGDDSHDDSSEITVFTGHAILLTGVPLGSVPVYTAPHRLLMVPELSIVPLLVMVPPSLVMMPLELRVMSPPSLVIVPLLVMLLMLLMMEPSLVMVPELL